MKEKEQFNLEEIKKKALEQFRSGKSPVFRTRPKT